MSSPLVPQRPLARRRAAALCLLLLLVAVATLARTRLTVAAHSVARADAPVLRAATKPAAEFVPGEILVRFRDDAPAAPKGARASLSVRAGGRAVEVEIENFGGSEIVRGLRLARVAPEETARAIEALRARPDVLYAEPNYVRRKSVAPNDARYGEQWGLRNTGQSVAGQPNGRAGADVKAEQAWDITRGSRSVVVGVVDEGVDISHPDLAANVWTNPGDDADHGFPGDLHGWDFVHNDASVYDGTAPYPTDETDAHGTHVAGIVGAVGDNGAGVVGVNWQVSLLPIKVLGADGGTDADIIRGYAYAKMLRDLWVATGGARGANVRVLNNSYGGPGFSQSALDAIRALNDSGILFVAAAGNSTADDDHVAQYPADYDAPNVVTVAATEQTDSVAFYSNYGARSVHLAAPGSAILSTTPGNTYSFFSGTSMAAPHVAGAAALLCAARSDATVAQMRAALLFSGDALPSLAGATYSRRRLNAFAALESLSENDTTPPAPAAGLSAEGTGRAKTLHWTAPGDDGNAGRAALYELDFVDAATSATYVLATQVPAAAGAQESATVNTPYRHASGNIVVKTFDNAGNASAASAPVSVLASDEDPYNITEGGGGGASSSGTAINLRADDAYLDFPLPFAFSLFGTVYNTVYVSTNGELRFTTPLNADGTVQPDLPGSAAALAAQPMIAGLWDDLRTDRRAGDDVYVYEPNADTVVFRWQAVTYDTLLPDGSRRGENPVNFEIELDRDGTIQTRYGAGNANLNPVVGVSAGSPDAYVIASHTSEFGQPLKSLDNAASVTFKPRTFSIRGRVTGADVFTQIKLTGTRNSTTNPDNNGDYAFNNLPEGGDYTVTPSSTSVAYQYVFTPPSQTFTNLSANQVADFTQRRVEYAIRGRVVDTGGAGAAGVNVVLNPIVAPRTTQTDAQGYYSFDNLPAGQGYTVAPASPDYTFTPTGQSVPNLSADVTLQDFVGRRLYNITGRVVDRSGNGVAGALINSGAPEFRSATTDASGNYKLAQLGAGNSYTVSASLVGYAVQPPTQTVSSLDSNRTLPDFLARKLYVIQGVVRDASGNGVSGVTVSLSGAATNTVQTAANGGYSLGSFPEGDNYTVTLSKPYYSFDTPTITYTNLGAHQSATVTGALAANTILGRVTDAGGQGVAAVSLALSGARAASAQTDNAGYYVFGDLADGASYTVTPSSDAYSFTPASLTFDNFSSGSVRSANFGATPKGNLRIDGSIDDGNGHPIARVQVNLRGPVNQFGVPLFASTTTDAAGQFSFTGLTGGATYTVAPVGDAFSGFSPISAAVALNANATVHFTATGLIAQPNSFQFAVSNISFGEGSSSAFIGVTRAGDTSAPASVDYATVDDPAPVPCNDTTTLPGVAFARCDYATTVGTITFAPGQNFKNITVPLVDDSFMEPNETIRLRLSNPVGAPLGALSTATITVLDDDAPGLQNPIQRTDFFVRMHYLDFLGREPEPQEPWSGLLNSCPNQFNSNVGAYDPVANPSARCDRVTVSANFFLSAEFQLKGAFVFRFYKASLGRLPHYTEFAPDTASVTGSTAQEVFQKKAAYADAFVRRAEFKSLYDSLSNAQFVNALMDRYSLQSIRTPSPATPDDPSDAAKVTLTRADLVSRLDAATLTRPQVVRAVADSDEVSSAEFNSAFVSMQYFGYLRRDPDPSGYGDWIGYLSAHPGQFRTMVFGFLYSPEYKLRFGQP